MLVYLLQGKFKMFDNTIRYADNRRSGFVIMKGTFMASYTNFFTEKSQSLLLMYLISCIIRADLQM